MHLSRAPDGQDVRTYDGSGEWVKIFTSGMDLKADGTFSWPLYTSYESKLPPRVWFKLAAWIFFLWLTNRLQIVFKIPEQTPAGQYLMRMDLPWSGMINQYINHGDVLTQLYPSCAQLNIKSSATGSLPKGVKIPEIFSPDVLGAFVFLLYYPCVYLPFCCKVW